MFIFSKNRNVMKILLGTALFWGFSWKANSLYAKPCEASEFDSSDFDCEGTPLPTSLYDSGVIKEAELKYSNSSLCMIHAEEQVKNLKNAAKEDLVALNNKKERVWKYVETLLPEKEENVKQQLKDFLEKKKNKPEEFNEDHYFCLDVISNIYRSIRDNNNFEDLSAVISFIQDENNNNPLVGKTLVKEIGMKPLLTPEQKSTVFGVDEEVITYSNFQSKLKNMQNMQDNRKIFDEAIFKRLLIYDNPKNIKIFKEGIMKFSELHQNVPYELGAKDLVLFLPFKENWHFNTFTLNAVKSAVTAAFGGELADRVAPSEEKQNNHIAIINLNNKDKLSFKKIDVQNKNKKLLLVYGDHANYTALFGYDKKYLEDVVNKVKNAGITFDYIIIEACLTGYMMSVFKPLLSDNGILFGTLKSGGLGMIPSLIEIENPSEIKKEDIINALYERSNNAAPSLKDIILTYEEKDLQQIKEDIIAWIDKNEKDWSTKLFDNNQEAKDFIDWYFEKRADFKKYYLNEKKENLENPFETGKGLEYLNKYKNREHATWQTSCGIAWLKDNQDLFNNDAKIIDYILVSFLKDDALKSYLTFMLMYSNSDKKYYHENATLVTEVVEFNTEKPFQIIKNQYDENEASKFQPVDSLIDTLKNMQNIQ